jgi:anti-anti-sigma regulatory factor
MLRILEVQGENGAITLRVDGRLAGQWVALLQSSCEAVLVHNSRLILDLGGVTFADRTGVDLLRRLQLRAVLLHGSLFLQEQLK